MSTIMLPQPDSQGGMPLAQAIVRRRSRRQFGDGRLSAGQVGQMLWAAQRFTGGKGRRAAPSAGGTYPLEIFLAVGPDAVEDWEAGLYAYAPAEPGLAPVRAGDLRAALAQACLGQDFLARAPVVIVVAAEYARTGRRYGERAGRYVDMEAGHVSQNVYLQAEALGLATVAVGAFDDAALADVLGLPGNLVPLYLMPVGPPA